MKKTLLFGFLFLAAISANAQVTFKPGIRAGANFSKITNTDLDYKTDFYVSAFGALKLSKFYTMQPEIGYSRQGAEGTVYMYDPYYDVSTTEDVDIQLEYVTFTLINKFTLTDYINVQVGPTFDIGTNTKDYLDDDVDLGATVGLGVTFPFGLSVEARVKKGLVDVTDDYYYSNDDYYYDYDENVNSNLVFQVGLSYSFDVTGSNK